MKTKLITNKATLKYLGKLGLIEYPTKYGDAKQIGEKDSRRFAHNGISYEVRYFDGSFYPFLFEA